MTKRLLVKLSLVIAGTFGLYLALLLHPDPLFAHEVRVENLVLHAREPLPAAALEVARAVHGRVARSPFYDPADTYHVYLCDTPRLFALVSVQHPKAGGVAQVGLGGNVFLRPSQVERDRLIGPRGQEVPGERTLTYFMAHELTHTMVARRLGRLAYFRLAAWQQEGYADYVGKGNDFDFTSTLAAFRAGAPELDPARSGLYLRYHLLTAYSLEQLGLTPEALLGTPRPRAPLEAALATAPPAQEAR